MPVAADTLTVSEAAVAVLTPRVVHGEVELEPRLGGRAQVGG